MPVTDLLRNLTQTHNGTEGIPVLKSHKPRSTRQRSDRGRLESNRKLWGEGGNHVQRALKPVPAFVRKVPLVQKYGGIGPGPAGLGPVAHGWGQGIFVYQSFLRFSGLQLSRNNAFSMITV